MGASVAGSVGGWVASVGASVATGTVAGGYVTALGAEVQPVISNAIKRIGIDSMCTAWFMRSPLWFQYNRNKLNCKGRTDCLHFVPMGQN